MPREMGELRWLCQEWNSLALVARDRGILFHGRRARTCRHFHMDRVVARARVEELRRLVAPFARADQSLLSNFGVELEFLMNRNLHVGESGREMIAQGLRDNGVNCLSERYNHITRTHWKITTDASLGSYSRGSEVVSPVLSGDAGFEALRNACKMLTNMGGKVNKRCGLHVHVEASTRGHKFLANLALMYREYEKVIDSFLSPSRRGPYGGNNFCRSVFVDDRKLAAAESVGDVMEAVGLPRSPINTRDPRRYRKLNFLSFWQPGTVEFRHHQGTVEVRKAEMWVRFCLRMCSKADRCELADVYQAPKDLEGLMEFLGCDAGESEYFKSRVDYFTQIERRAA